LSGLSHDPLQRDIFGPLWVGATICIPQDDTIGTPGQLAEWMAREGITFTHLTPAMSRILTETPRSDLSLLSLRHAFFVGDRLTRTDVERLRKLAPDVTCINSYGSTETQRAVAYYPIPSKYQDSWARSVYPLGSGMPDVQLLVLKADGELAGVGELGEIHVRSPHLARGYLGDETLTRDRFLTNPYTNAENDRLYRTSDLGRYLPDGTVEFAGRDDQQVKIRGFRIELGEIETALRQYQGVQEATVLAREDRPGQLRLVAYVVHEQDQALATAELRDHLSARLPDYMVPSAFVSLEAVPLTPNGKLDRQALPAPDAFLVEFESNYVAPRAPDEEALVGIWSRVLGIERVGVRDNFFELGGHSLLGVRLFSLINSEFEVELPLAALFRAPTIERLAGLIRDSDAQDVARISSLVTIRSAGTKLPLFVIPGNLGNVFVDLGHLSEYLDQDQPFYGLQDWTGNPARIEALAAEYVKEIRQVQTKGPYILAGVCSGAVVALEMAQQLQAQGHTVSLLAMIEPPQPHQPRLETYATFAFSLLRQVGRRLRHTALTLVRRPPAGQGEYVRLKLKVVANRWALRRYLPRPYAGRIEIFLTEQSLRSVQNRQLTWGEYALAGAGLHEIPGNHATITGAGDTPIESAHMQALAQQLGACIDAAVATR
jgi:thioesterase domain-containing protein